MTFGQKLSNALKKAKITQSELSRRTGINKAIISEYIHDKYEAKQHNLFKIATALNIPVSELIGEPFEKSLPPIPEEKTENLLLTMFSDHPEILEFLHEHKFAMQGDISVIGEEEITLVKHAILSSIVKAQRHAKKHGITDNTPSGQAQIVVKKEDKK